MIRSRLAAAALVLLTLTTARPSIAAWPHDPNNGNVALCTATGDQTLAKLVSDGAGGAIVTWQDNRTGTGFDIYVQRLNAAGVPQWGANGVALCTATGNQATPVLVADGAGGAVVAWYDARNGLNYDIYAQRVNAAGVVQWAVNGVALCTSSGDQLACTIATDGAGGAIVTWRDYRSATSNDIYAQRIGPAGSVIWPVNGVPLCTIVGDQVEPTIASDGAGGAIVTWQDLRNGANNDIYAQRVNATGSTQWTAGGVTVCASTGEQSTPLIAPDGAGGAVIAWPDYRSGTNNDIYAQRISPAGSVQWTTNGVAVSAAASSQITPALASDGAGGAVVAWADYRSGTTFDIYAQRVGASGAPQWTANGVALCTAASDQYYPTIISDGAGGAVVAWYDARSSTNYDIYAQRISAAGATRWTADGAALCMAPSNQFYPTLVSDGADGTVVAWHDYRSGSYDIYTQRIERFGQLGNPEPTIVNVKDYPSDQGGRVRIKWDASYLDSEPYNLVGSYHVWRQAPPFAAQAALEGGSARLLSEEGSPAGVSRGAYRVTQSASGPYYWEFVGSQIAQGFPGYSYVTDTGSDSVAAGNPPTRFMIEAVANYASVPAAHWDSAPDSGYSVDNLPPAAPAPFTGQYSAGSTSLHWNRNGEADLAGYRLYRGSSAGFVPGPGNLVSAVPDTGYVDAAAAPYVYKLTAVDSHGNESPVATLVPSGTLGVEDGAALALSFAAPNPNPARGESTLRYALSRAGHVRLAVYDAAGRRVRVLRDAELPAGAHEQSFALRDDSGRALASGLYLVRLEAEGRVITRRLATIR